MNPRSIRVGRRQGGDRHDERARRGFESSAAGCAKLMNNVLNPLFGVCRMNPRSIRVGRRHGGDRPDERAIRHGFGYGAANGHMGVARTGFVGEDTVRKARSVREMHDARCKAVLLDVCIREMGLS